MYGCIDITLAKKALVEMFRDTGPFLQEDRETPRKQ